MGFIDNESEEDYPPNTLDYCRREWLRLRYFYSRILGKWMPPDMRERLEEEDVDYLKDFLPTVMTIGPEKERIKSLVVIPNKEESK